LALFALGCTSNEPDESPEPSPLEQLEACGLPEPCTRPTEGKLCGSEGVPYQDHDVCNFEALLAEPPNVVGASLSGLVCGYPSNSRIEIYRWVDGTMTCAFVDTFVDEFGSYVEAVWARSCSLPDTATIEACLADAQAGAPATEACLSFSSWGLELGDEVEPTCRA
jgi:hypothetical protein